MNKGWVVQPNNAFGGPVQSPQVPPTAQPQGVGSLGATPSLNGPGTSNPASTPQNGANVFGNQPGVAPGQPNPGQENNPPAVAPNLNLNQNTPAVAGIPGTQPPEAQPPITQFREAPAANAAAPGQQGAKAAKEADVKNPNSTQNSLLISQIRNDMVIMSDGTFRGVVTCQSINFDLMSTAEQEGIEASFQGFINSLYYPIQIFMRSQRVDIEPYLKYINGLRVKQENMLLGNLMDNYMDFIDRLAAEANIMNKAFFVVVEFDPAGNINSQTNSTKNLFSNLFSADKQQSLTISAQTFTKAKEEIGNRTTAVINGLEAIGINSKRLSTKELVTLYYNIYNPDTALNEPLGDFKNFTNLYTSKGAVESQPGAAQPGNLGGQNG
jgi:hypothetical protein